MANGTTFYGKLDNALDRFFDQVVTERLTMKKADEDRRAGVLTSLLQMELNQQGADRQWLLDRGLQLPQQDQTAQFAEILELTGNLKLETTLNMMLDSAKDHSSYLGNAINQYHQGVTLAKDFDKLQLAASEGEVGTERYLYSEEEIAGLMETGKIDADLWSDPNYQQGFQAGSMDLAGAMAAVEKETNIYATSRALEAGEIQQALDYNASLMESVGSDIILNTIKYNLPFAAFKGALAGDEEVRGSYLETLNAYVNDQTMYPNIKGELVSAIQAYAQAPGGLNQHAGFIKLSHSAYELLMHNNNLENQLMQQRTDIVSLDQAKALLMESNEVYHNNALKLEEYASIGILENMTTLQQAYQIMNDTNRIEEQQLNSINKGAEKISQLTGMNYEAAINSLDTIPVGNIDESLANMNIADDIYNQSIGTGELDPALSLSLGALESPAATKAALDVSTAKTEVQTAKVTYKNAFRDILSFVQWIPDPDDPMSGASIWGQGGLPGLGYRPNSKQLNAMKNKISDTVKQWLDPDRPGAMGDVPILGMFAGPRGAEGVMANVESASDLIQRWNDFLKAYSALPELSKEYKESLQKYMLSVGLETK